MDKGTAEEKEKILMSAQKKTVLASGVLYAAFMAAYTDYLAYGPAGRAISIAACLLVLAAALAAFRYGLLLALLFLFTFPSFPRDILDIYPALRDTADMSFYSINYTQAAGFSLSMWMMAGLSAIALMRFLSRGGRMEGGEPGRLIALLFCFIVLLFPGALQSAFLGRDFYLKEFISDLRFPLLFIAGGVAAWEYAQDSGGVSEAIRKIMGLLVFILAVSGMKTVFFLLDDRLNGNLRLGFANPVYLVFPFLLAWAAGKEETGFRIEEPVFILLGAAAVFPEGRGAVIIYVLATILAFMVTFIKERARMAGFTGMALMTVSGIALSVFAVSLVNGRLWNFLAFKMSFFTNELWTGELSESPLSRVYELKNIMAENADTITGLLWGRGAGSYFTFRHFPLAWNFEAPDYTLFEREAGIYFHPHLPLNYWLLKGGVLGLAIYGYVFLKMFRTGYAGVSLTGRSQEKGFAFFLAVSSVTGFFQSFWQPAYIFFYSLVMTLGLMLLERGAEG